jgi:glycosyltransferase involved in cell wall biosynthesis
MRVIHVVTAYPRHASDPITPWLVKLLRAQSSAGLQVEVLAPAYRGGPAGDIDGTAVHRFRYAPAILESLTHDETVPDRLRRSPAYGALVPTYLAAGARAGARLGRTAPDVVHVHWPVPHALFGASMRRASGGRTAMVCSYYSAELTWVKHTLPRLQRFARWTIRTADAVTAISESTADLVRSFVERDVAVIPYGAALVDDGRPLTRLPFSDPGQPMQILFVGRLVQRKGVEVLVDALSRMGTDARLTVVGAGEWEGRIREAVARHGLEKVVEFTGQVSTEELARRYEMADVFVLPAVTDDKGDTEGLGVVLLEAMRFERPVVASAAGGIVDIIRHEENGWLVPEGDAWALATLLDRMAGNPTVARSVATFARADARHRFAWQTIVGSTTEVYRAALESRRA